MSTLITEVQDGILFILDPGNSDAVVPKYMDDHVVSSTDTCISISTQPSCDGETKVSISSDDLPTHLYKVFEGKIALPSKAAALVTSDFNRLFELELKSDIALVTVFVDDLISPNDILVVMKEWK